MDILSSQKSVLEFLINSKKQNRLSHAYMFDGPKGVGKLDVALYFVCMLWCSEDEPCLKCNTCKQILNLNFLNLIYINTQKEIITVDQITKLQKEFASTATLEGPRVYIIDDADKMQHRVQNKLLKFIEEPVSDQTYGILLTTNKEKIISTIHSRVINQSLKELSYDFLVDKLQKFDVEFKYASLIAHIENNVATSIDLLNGSDQLVVINLIYKFIEQLAQRKIAFFYKENIEVLSNKKNLVLFINLLMEFYKDLYSVMNNRLPSTYKTIDFSLLSKVYNCEYIMKIIEELVELEQNLRYNVNINLNAIKLFMVLNGGVNN